MLHRLATLLPLALAALTAVEAQAGCTIESLASVALAGRVRDVELSGGHAYLAVGTDGLVVVDVTTPGSPSVVASVPASGYAHDVEIGRLPGDSTAQAQGINRRGQVVGVSSGNAGNRAFLWEDGRLYDLNALVAGAVPGTLVSARDINDAGQITGDLREGATGRTVPFVLTPARR